MRGSILPSFLFSFTQKQLCGSSLHPCLKRKAELINRQLRIVSATSVCYNGCQRFLQIIFFAFRNTRYGSMYEKMVTYVSCSQGNSEYSKALDKEFVGREHLHAHSRVSIPVFSRTGDESAAAGSAACGDSGRGANQ
jgi:hypothetical protein